MSGASPFVVFGVLALSCLKAWAWDQHHLVTRGALLGFKTQNAPLWQSLNAPIQVTPIEQFLKHAFGPACRLDSFKNDLLEGVGESFEFLYTDTIARRFEIDFAKGSNRMILEPAREGSPHELGRAVTPAEVLAVFSDEPDWNMDDDVPRLKGKGLSKDAVGTATRLLRHFWYENEVSWGVNFGKDQETDRRAELLYEMALIAFDAGEPYWAYRFLGNAIHYLQDIAQPYHARAIINESMIDTISLLRAGLCELRKSSECTPEFTVDQQIIKNSWVVGAYHGSFEDLVRGLLSPLQPHQSYVWLSDFSGRYNKAKYQIDWNPGRQDLLIHGLASVRAAQSAALKLADPIGELSLKALGFTYKYDMQKTQEAILGLGTEDSFWVRVAKLSRWMHFGLTDRQLRHLPLLVEQAHESLALAGTWSRQLVRRAHASLEDGATLERVRGLREKLRRKCASSSSH